MTNDELNEIWIEAETQGSIHRLNAQALIVEVRRMNAKLSKLCYQHDHMAAAIIYAIEAIDGNDVISAHQRLTATSAIVENADAHKDEWNAYR